MQTRLGATIGAIMLAVFLGLGSLPATPAHADGGARPCEPQIGTELPEPNDSQVLFIGSLCGGTFTGTIESPGDVALFAARAIRPGKDLRATLTVPAGQDYDLRALDPGRTQVLSWKHRGRGPDRGVRVRNNTGCNHDYRLRIFSFDGSSSSARYTLLVDKSF